MISSSINTEQVLRDASAIIQRSAKDRRKRNVLRGMMWLLLLLACLGTSLFAYQYFVVPQQRDFTPDWQGAQWVQATDGNAPVAYFRYISQLDSLPDSAFVTITASQTFLLFVNGNYIGSNSVDFVQGDAPRAYMYDVDSALQPGPNVVAVRVANVDNQAPSLRASFGTVIGHTIIYHGTGERSWQATAQANLAHPRYTPKGQNWFTTLFDSSSWSSTRIATGTFGSPKLTVNPMTYERPLPTSWINAGAGQDSYFTHQFSLPSGFNETLLRINATGNADIFINDHLLAVWQGQVIVPQENVVSYLSDGSPVLEYRAGLAMGVYDISHFVHTGTNTIAVHVASPGLTAAKVGLSTFGAAMSLDVISASATQQSTLVTSDTNWYASTRPAQNWTRQNGSSLSWPQAALLGRPGQSSTFYLPDSNTPRNQQVVGLDTISEVIVLSILAVIGLWLLMALVVVKRYYPSRREALEATSLIFVPSLALEGLLLTFSREPQIPNPFPFTGPWGLVLILLVGITGLFLWLHARRTSIQRTTSSANDAYGVESTSRPRSSFPGIAPLHTFSQSRLSPRVRSWLARHWGLIPIVLLAIPMISYNLGYEPYWQDELSSYYAAKGILAHGLPIYISGFLYAKGELYSYLLALSMTIFGDQNGLPRLVSMIEFLVSLPLFYGIGCYFFNRRVALLATAMLAFSPYALLWGRQTRMYEQAFLMILLVIYLLYYAVQNYQRARPAYLAVAMVVLAYFSHEETFIALPAIVICALVASPRGKYGIPAIMRQKHWWIAALIGVALIGFQLVIVFVTHPPHLGTDQSRRPQIQPTFDNIPFYLGLLFNSRVLKDGIAPWIIVQPLLALSSALAILGCFWALRHGNHKARYCALFLVVSMLTLTFIFTMQADRYVYPIFSIYYLMSSYAILRILRTIWVFARPYLRSQQRNSMATTRPSHVSSLPVRFIVGATACVVCLSTLILPMFPLSNYNLFFSRATGISYHRHFPDYDDAGQYVKSHWQKGDIIATIAPDLSTYYYFDGHSEYFFSIDRSLYLFERDNQIIDTSLGVRALLNQADFQALLASHDRVWLVTDNGNYQAGVTKEGRFVFPPPDFQMVYEGYGSAVYFRGS